MTDDVITTAIATHGARAICEATRTGLADIAGRMISVGLPAPETMADAWRAHQAAYAALDPIDRQAYDRAARVSSAYLGPAVAAGGKISTFPIGERLFDDRR